MYKATATLKTSFQEPAIKDHMIENQERSCKKKSKLQNKEGTLRPRWSIKPVAAVPKTPASTPAVFDSPSNTP